MTGFPTPFLVLGNLVMKKCTLDQGDYFFYYNLHTPVAQKMLLVEQVRSQQFSSSTAIFQ